MQSRWDSQQYVGLKSSCQREHRADLPASVPKAACISVVILWFGLARQNRIRDAKYGPVEEQKVSKPTYAHDTDANAGEGEKGLAVTRHQADVTEEYKERWGLQGMSREEIVELGDDVSWVPLEMT